MKVKLDDIHVDDSFNCRGYIAPMDIYELAASIKEDGLIQPVTITNNKDRFIKQPYKLVAGYRRYKAVAYLGWDEIEAVLKPDLDDLTARSINLMENVQRQDLNIQQEAYALKAFFDKGLEDEDIAQKLGVSKNWVTIRRMLLELPEPIHKEAALRNITQNEIRTLHQIYKTDGEEECYRVCRYFKTQHMRDLTVEAVKQVERKKKYHSKKQRNKTEIFLLIKQLLDCFGECTYTKLLAWCAGTLDEEELFDLLREEAKAQGKTFIPPMPEKELKLLGR